MATLDEVFWKEFSKVMEECRRNNYPYPLPNNPPKSIRDMEYREDFGFNYDLYLEELNKSKKDN